MASTSAQTAHTAQSAAELIYKSLQQGASGKQQLVQVLATRPSHERAAIASAFAAGAGRQMRAAFKDALSGDFYQICKGLCYLLSEYDAKCLRYSVKGAGTDEEGLIDIITTRNNLQIRAIKVAYNNLYKRDLIADVQSDVSGNFCEVLTQILSASRDENRQVSEQLAAQDAELLYSAGEDKFGTDEAVFTRILCSRALPHLAAVSQEYSGRYGSTLADVIKSETAGNYRNVLLSILSFATDPAGHVANQFYRCFRGIGTNDRRLQRLAITQSEADIASVKMAYQQQHGRSMIEDLRSETSGSYRSALLALVGE